MIYVLVQDASSRTFENFLKHWKPDPCPDVRLVAYERATTLEPVGCVLFADLERLSPDELTQAADIHDRLVEGLGDERVLNDPRSTMTRRDLLETLTRAGKNSFRVHRIDVPLEEVRLPAFVRDAHKHGGPSSPLLHSREELAAAVSRAKDAYEARAADPNRLMIVEFEDTSQSGVFSKYASFIVGEAIVPRHLLFSRDWMIKVADGDDRDLGDASLCARELAFVSGDEHSSEIREIARLGRIDYGRVDYSIKDGSIQVWEVNLNPTICSSPPRYVERQLPAQRVFARRFADALRAIDVKGAE